METSVTNTRTDAGKKAAPGAQPGQRDAGEQRITRASGNFSPMSWTGHPLDTMMRMSREMDQLMDSFFGGRLGFPRFGREATTRSAMPELWTPRIDMRQSGQNLVINAELPGIDRDAVKIEATEDGIAISGERQQSREEGAGEADYHLSERSYGSFYRTIPLPEGAQADQAKARMRDGVLEITVPCKQTAPRRQIQISD